MKPIIRALLASVMLANLFAAPVRADSFDIVIAGGRVVDPESGLDAVRSVAIDGGKIVAISAGPLEGRQTIDATGLIVSPGFIDMHAHGQDILGARMQALDGVTTGLDLEAGMLPVQDYYDRVGREGRPINYGASVNWANARIATFLGEKPVADLHWFLKAFRHPEWQKEIATPEQLAEIRRHVSEGLDQGGLGIGVLVGYAPGSGHKEFFEIHRLAAERGVPTFTHARYLSMLEPGSSFQGMAEIVAAAAGTKAHTHISHLNSISIRDIGLIGEMIATAQAQGLRVTTEAYPYGAGSTGIGAAMFRGDRWRERIGGINASNFDVGGKRLTEEEFARYQREQPQTTTIVHFLEENKPEDRKFLDQAVLFPGGVIASDGMDWRLDGRPVPQHTWPVPENAWSHPRSAGTFARFIRTYVREQQAVSLLEAIEKVSLGPARILQDAVPQMRAKGRIQVGADADITVFDLATITDKATYAKPAQASEGVTHVIVNGVLLVKDGELDTNVLPGRPIRNRVE